MKTLRDAKIYGNKILLAVDYNVPISHSIVDCAFKIDQTMPTIQYILSQDPKLLVITTHLGRPSNTKEYSTIPIFKYLKSIIDIIEYKTIEELNCDAEESQRLYFTDNLRYYSPESLESYYSKFDIIINDAFGSSHRKTPYKSYAGLLMIKEIEKLSKCEDSNLLVMGGSKINEKLKILEIYKKRVYLGGCLSLSIYKSLGFEIGKGTKFENYNVSSILGRISEHLKKNLKINNFSKEAESNETIKAKDVNINDVHIKSGEIILPVDFLVINNGKYEMKNFNEILESDTCIDLGEKSIQLLKGLIEEVETNIFMNGPLGKFEDERAISTREIIKSLENRNAILGGGETLTAVLKYSKIEKFAHISTGGGALLDFINKMKMPGIENIYE
jgi:phosphoglycerate kinase